MFPSHQAEQIAKTMRKRRRTAQVIKKLKEDNEPFTLKNYEIYEGRKNIGQETESIEETDSRWTHVQGDSSSKTQKTSLEEPGEKTESVETTVEESKETDGTWTHILGDSASETQKTKKLADKGNNN